MYENDLDYYKPIPLLVLLEAIAAYAGTRSVRHNDELNRFDVSEELPIRSGPNVLIRDRLRVQTESGISDSILSYAAILSLQIPVGLEGGSGSAEPMISIAALMTFPRLLLLQEQSRESGSVLGMGRTAMIFQ